MSLLGEIQSRHKAFHASIARRAALVPQKEERTFSIPNAPFGTPKFKPVIQPIRESDYWHRMWCFNLVFDLPKMEAFTAERITIRQIQDAICERYEVKLSDLLSVSRARHISIPRQIGYYLSRTLAGRSFPEIAARFGGRDHTSALHGFRKIEALLLKDEALRDQVSSISLSLGAIP